MEICESNQPFCNFTQINPKLSSILIWEKFINSKSRKWMFLLFEASLIQKVSEGLYGVGAFNESYITRKSWNKNIKQ